MRNELTAILVFGVAVFAASSLCASPSNQPALQAPLDNLGDVCAIKGDLIPLSVRAYRDRNDAAVDLPTIRPESGGLRRLQDGEPGYGFLRSGADVSPKKTSYFPVLLSLLVPGAGEISMGYYIRGVALVGIEVLAWTGYAVYHDKGLDSRAAYERFADEHWSYDKWIIDHRVMEVNDVPPTERTFELLYELGETWDQWPGFHSWHSKEEEKQNYYENIGKYDWFISGWEDWRWEDFPDRDNPPRKTALRDQYRSMRKTSNDELDKATNFIYLSIAARVFSLVETVLLVRKDVGEETAGVPKTFTVGARPTGLQSGKIELRYKW